MTCQHRWILWDYLLPLRLKVCKKCGAQKEPKP
jgi:hypothetical protein